MNPKLMKLRFIFNNWEEVYSDCYNLRTDSGEVVHSVSCDTLHEREEIVGEVFCGTRILLHRSLIPDNPTPYSLYTSDGRALVTGMGSHYNCLQAYLPRFLSECRPSLETLRCWVRYLPRFLTCHITLYTAVQDAYGLSDIYVLLFGHDARNKFLATLYYITRHGAVSILADGGMHQSVHSVSDSLLSLHCWWFFGESSEIDRKQGGCLELRSFRSVLLFRFSGRVLHHITDSVSYPLAKTPTSDGYYIAILNYTCAEPETYSMDIQYLDFSCSKLVLNPFRSFSVRNRVFRRIGDTLEGDTLEGDTLSKQFATPKYCSHEDIERILDAYISCDTSILDSYNDMFYELFDDTKQEEYILLTHYLPTSNFLSAITRDARTAFSLFQIDRQRDSYSKIL